MVALHWCTGFHCKDNIDENWEYLHFEMNFNESKSFSGVGDDWGWESLFLVLDSFPAWDTEAEVILRRNCTSDVRDHNSSLFGSPSLDVVPLQLHALSLNYPNHQQQNSLCHWVFSSILGLQSCHHTSNGCSTQLTRISVLYFLTELSVDFSIQYCIVGLVGTTEHLKSDDNRI